MLDALRSSPDQSNKNSDVRWSRLSRTGVRELVLTQSSVFEWMFDGGVSTSVRVGNTLYVGGAFRNVIPPSGVLGSLYGVAPSSGAAVPSIMPRIDVPVRAMLPDGGGGYYLHGNFFIGTGNATGRVVHIRPDGSMDPLFNSPAQLTGGGVMVRDDDRFVGAAND